MLSRPAERINRASASLVSSSRRNAFFINGIILASPVAAAWEGIEAASQKVQHTLQGWVNERRHFQPPARFSVSDRFLSTETVLICVCLAVETTYVPPNLRSHWFTRLRCRSHGHGRLGPGAAA